MFKKILIANRGEIACRIIATARKMGILCVAVYSDVDRDALHVHMADEAIAIGGAAPAESYLSADRIVQAALRTRAEAIHPGYGFLAENGDFCNRCNENNIVFIGPPVAAIEAMGSKSAAKSLMIEAEVPVIPGYHGKGQEVSTLKEAAENLGYPVLIKASAGGGGKGMRQVWSASEFAEALAAARREAKKSFDDDAMLVEKYLAGPRHVEIQIFCDQHGNAVYLGERDCSIQRRHQKIIEEAPAPALTMGLRRQMGEAAVRAARAIGYVGAGTVEFLLDQSEAFYFMEMNTRLQVEHPVTEMVTGQDLVEWQLLAASGERLPLRQDEIQITGHAIEARIYAEDPARDFLPASGTLTFLQSPLENRHVRVDSGVRQGDEISVYYDPMIAKLIVWDEDRVKAIGRLARALSEYRISGMPTNVDFLYSLASSDSFQHGRIDTAFVEQHLRGRVDEDSGDMERGLVLAALYRVLRLAQQAAEGAALSADPWSPWNSAGSWRLNEPHVYSFALLCKGTSYSIDVEQVGRERAGRYAIRLGDRSIQAEGKIEGSKLCAIIDGHRLQAQIDDRNNTYRIFTQEGVLECALQQA
ncbi:MAG: acetyl-CoA carboxylase biotin carboxylase subunit, partial [Desulforhopalus sp.]